MQAVSAAYTEHEKAMAAQREKEEAAAGARSCARVRSARARPRRCVRVDESAEAHAQNMYAPACMHQKTYAPARMY